MLKNGLRNQRVYGLAVSLAAYACKVTSKVPMDVRPVRRQLIRSVTSIGLNFAEGWGESAPAEKARFYRMARRSATETAGALDLLVALNVIAKDVIDRTDPALDEIHAMLTRMAKTQEAAAAAQPSGSGRRVRNRNAAAPTTKRNATKPHDATDEAEPRN